jgi:hypothetical protein
VESYHFLSVRALFLPTRIKSDIIEPRYMRSYDSAEMTF